MVYYNTKPAIMVNKVRKEKNGVLVYNPKVQVESEGEVYPATWRPGEVPGPLYGSCGLGLHGRYSRKILQRA